jgi:hypothetical protein
MLQQDFGCAEVQLSGEKSSVVGYSPQFKSPGNRSQNLERRPTRELGIAPGSRLGNLERNKDDRCWRRSRSPRPEAEPAQQSEYFSDTPFHQYGEKRFESFESPRPAMTTITNKKEALTCYQTYSKTLVAGFVVNVHDCLNFDIDLLLTPELARRYETVIKQPYRYIDFSRELKEAAEVDSRTYRCRLLGIETIPVHMEQELKINVALERSNYHAADPAITSSNEVFNGEGQSSAVNQVNHLIDRAGGWVICALTDVDIYRRLLVEIIVPIKEWRIGLKQLLLQYPNFRLYNYSYKNGKERKTTVGSDEF